MQGATSLLASLPYPRATKVCSPVHETKQILQVIEINESFMLRNG